MPPRKRRTPNTPADAPVPTIEYIHLAKAPKDLTRILTEMSAEGWEVCAMARDNIGRLDVLLSRRIRFDVTITDPSASNITGNTIPNT